MQKINKYVLVGLGNPGDEYKDSRHNAGRMAVQFFQTSSSKLKAKSLNVIESGEFMNNSGRAVAKFVKTKKAAQGLIVVYDDLDLALGTIKISYNKSDGGHRGLESVIKAVKTREFIRIRIGIAPTTPSGKIKKPGSGDLPAQAGKKVLDFILGKFGTKESEVLKKVFKKTSEAIEMIVDDGYERAMNIYNT